MDFNNIYNLLTSNGINENWVIVNNMYDDVKNNKDYYNFINKYIELLNSDKAHVRLRTFIMIVKVAKWDDNNYINNNIETILKVLNDDKPAFVRVAISYISELISNKPLLMDTIIKFINAIDYSKYKDSMIPLLKKDFKKVLDEYE